MESAKTLISTLRTRCNMNLFNHAQGKHSPVFEFIEEVKKEEAEEKVRADGRAQFEAYLRERAPK